MHDDISRGAGAPIETGGGRWEDLGTSQRSGETNEHDLLGVELTAVVLSVRQEQPVALATFPESGPRNASLVLPKSRFSPAREANLEAAIRHTISRSSDLTLGYVEQLLTDFDPGADATVAHGHYGDRIVSLSYLALTREDETHPTAHSVWIKCYDVLPWEDHRNGRPEYLTRDILPRLEAWTTETEASNGCVQATSCRERINIAFGSGGRCWDDQRVLDRLELIEAAGVELPEKARSISAHDRRLIAAGLGRLRAKLRYRPVVFELLPSEFTLFELQRAVEAILGPTLHKQNFRRLVEGTGLVEATGDVRTNTGGRPAKTFRFRREVLLEQAAPGVHVRTGRAA